MSSRPRASRLVVALSLALTVAGCSSWRGARVPEPAPVSAPATPLRTKKVLLDLTNGKTIELWHPVVEGDSLRGELSTKRHVAIALKDIRAIDVRQHSTGKTVGLILGTLVVCGGILVLIALIELGNSD